MALIKLKYKIRGYMIYESYIIQNKKNIINNLIIHTIKLMNIKKEEESINLTYSWLINKKNLNKQYKILLISWHML